jgi:GDP-4-dehydro-6-deoxy-D-mannose reductase
MRIVVTGAGGFIGSFLEEALVRRGDQVAAWTRDDVDITDLPAVQVALERFDPNAVVHLAARSLPGRSWNDPTETYRVNVGGTIAILEAARRLSSPPRVLIAGSSAEYAEPDDGAPLSEGAVLEPNSPYGSSKIAAYEIANLFHKHYGLPIIGFRPFALIGPRKTGDACSDFARRIVAIERGTATSMVVGDLSVVRDMVDVRDGAEAILRLIDEGATGEVYNICSGRGVGIGEMLEAFRAQATMPIDVTRDATLLRPLEQKVKIGDPSKLRALGWTTARSLEETLADTLAFWRKQER